MAPVWSGLGWPSSLDDESAIVVQSMSTQLSSETMEELVWLINPLAFSDDLGIDLYVHTVHFVFSTIA